MRSLCKSLARRFWGCSQNQQLGKTSGAKECLVKPQNSRSSPPQIEPRLPRERLPSSSSASLLHLSYGAANLTGSVTAALKNNCPASQNTDLFSFWLLPTIVSGLWRGDKTFSSCLNLIYVQYEQVLAPHPPLQSLQPKDAHTWLMVDVLLTMLYASKCYC